MTVQRAFAQVVTKHPNMKVWSATEFDSAFAFCLVPQNYDSNEPPLTGLIGVDKKTGKDFHFNPINMPLDEYKRGKKLDISIFE